MFSLHVTLGLPLCSRGLGSPTTRALATRSVQCAKTKVSAGLDDGLVGYLLQHTRETEVLKDLRRETAELFPAAARMQITPDQGAFMHWLVATLRATRAIEVGVFTGYSSIATATALGPGGKLLACDPDERALAVARRCWDRAGVLDRIVEHVRPARETLELLLSAGEAGQYDFAFVDADKRGYMGYYEQLLQLVRPGGVIAFDNVLWYGQVADAGATDARTEAIRELNSFLLADERILFSLLPIGDGLALCTKK